jgi:hypothetical protein
MQKVIGKGAELQGGNVGKGVGAASEGLLW